MINVEVILDSKPLDVWAAFLHDAEVGRAIVDLIGLFRSQPREVNNVESLRIPIRMRRPAGIGKALYRSPLVEACRGTLPQCQRCSRDVRSRKPRDRPCGATSRRAGIECEGRRGRDFSLGRGLDPKPRTIWQRHSRREKSLFRLRADPESVRVPLVRSILRHHWRRG